MKFRVERLNDIIAHTRPDFESYLRDKSYPLAERWDVFLLAPDSLSNRSPWAPDIPPLEAVKYDWLSMYIDGRARFPDIYLPDFILDLEDNTLGDEGSPYYLENWAETIDNVKEWILDQNLKWMAINW